MQELRPVALDQIILHHRPDGIAATGDALHNALGFLPAFGGVQNHQLPHAMRTVVTGEDADDFADVAERRLSRCVSDDRLAHREANALGLFPVPEPADDHEFPPVLCP